MISVNALAGQKAIATISYPDNAAMISRKILTYLPGRHHDAFMWDEDPRYANAVCATNLDLIAYTADRVLETFPFPPLTDTLVDVGRRYSEFRDDLRLRLHLALTEIYNRFHDRSEKSEDIARMRALHEEMDQAVAAAYGWSDLDLGHGFHATKQASSKKKKTNAFTPQSQLVKPPQPELFA
jgi:hypothetical protein